MFDDIRPYTDVEIPAAMRRITADPQFASICRYVFPDTPFSEVEDMMLRCRNIYEFQHVFMYPVMKFIEKSSTHGLSYSGFGNLDKNQGYLFVSNHRDIVLDAAFLQVLLDKEDMETAEISFGANLMISPMIVDLGKANKMYKVERPDTVSSPREFFYKSQYLSEYIRHVVTENNSSIWIAQRNGRTKDGKDATDSGIVRMFSMSGKGDPVADMAALQSLLWPYHTSGNHATCLRPGNCMQGKCRGNTARLRERISTASLPESASRKAGYSSVSASLSRQRTWLLSQVCAATISIRKSHA